MSSAAPGARPRARYQRALRALAVRELRSPVSLTLASSIIVLSGLAGSRQAAPPSTPRAADALLDYSALALANYPDLLIILCSLVGAGLAIERTTGDRESGWLVPLVARGGSRAWYPLALGGVVAGVSVLTMTVGLLAFTVAARLTGTASGELVMIWPTGVLAVTSALTFGVALGLVGRRRGIAYAAALLLLVIPILATLWVLMRTGALPPRPLHLLMFAHLPPLRGAATPASVAHHLAYITALLGGASALSARFVGRYR